MTNNAAGGKAELEDFLPGMRKEVGAEEFMDYICARFASD